MTRAALILALCWIAYAQGQESGPVFEVASVKPATANPGQRLGCFGGPGTSDPGRFTCNNALVAHLVRQAFDIDSWQLKIKSPDHLPTIVYGDLPPIGYDVAAKVPAGATKEDFRIMVRNLLVQRFKFTCHWEKGETDLYELGIAKKGAKLRSTDLDKVTEPVSGYPRMTSKDAYGCPVYGENHAGLYMIGLGSQVCVSATAVTMEQLRDLVQSLLGLPVHDGTGLAGKYDFSLNFDLAATRGIVRSTEVEPGPTLAAAFQEQLGLLLQKKTGAVDYFVVDHVEKTPTEN